jgi:hypothetical protein
MMEDDQGDNSLYRRYATKVLWINGCVALALIMFVLWVVAISPRQPGAEAATGAEVAIGIVPLLWCFFCLPISTFLVAVGSVRKGRIKERKTKLIQGFCLLLLVFWMLLLLALFQ